MRASARSLSAAATASQPYCGRPGSGGSSPVHDWSPSRSSTVRSSRTNSVAARATMTRFSGCFFSGCFFSGCFTEQQCRSRCGGPSSAALRRARAGCFPPRGTPAARGVPPRRMRSPLTASTFFLLLPCFWASCAQPPAVQPHAGPDMARHPPAAGGMPATAPAPQFTLAPTPAAALGTAPAGLGLHVGQEAPDAKLADVTGASHSLKARYGSGPTLVMFYRGGWCPFCNLQLHEYSEAKGEFERRGVQIVAISVDQPSAEAKTQMRHGVPFLMLSDSRLDAHRAFHVVHVQ